MKMEKVSVKGITMSEALALPNDMVYYIPFRKERLEVKLQEIANTIKGAVDGACARRGLSNVIPLQGDEITVNFLRRGDFTIVTLMAVCANIMCIGIGVSKKSIQDANVEKPLSGFYNAAFRAAVHLNQEIQQVKGWN